MKANRATIRMGEKGWWVRYIEEKSLEFLEKLQNILGQNVRRQNEIIEGGRLQGRDEEEKGAGKQEIIAIG
jgi:hypothetical protein